MSSLYKAVSSTTQIKADAGKLLNLIVSSTTSGTITIYDSATASTGDPVILATLTPTAGMVIDFSEQGVWFSRGLYIVIANTLAVTLVYT